MTADHEICRMVLRDDRLGFGNPLNTGLPQPLQALFSKTDLQLPNPVEPPSMLLTDPPHHTRYRSLVSQSFTPRAIGKLTAKITELTTELLDSFEADEQMDLVTEFAAQLAVAVIAEILDLPIVARPQLLEWGHQAVTLLDIGITWRAFRRAIDGLHEVDRYLSEHFEQWRDGAPGHSPFSRMAVDGALSYREFAANAALLIGGGFETMVNLIGNGIFLLLEHPDQLARLREQPDLWPAAVEEILRFESPTQMTVRTAHRDVEIAGERIAAGEMVILLLGGANRDPSVFAQPNRFDITRPNAREHLEFGSGMHACVGAALARMEGTIALRALFERFPNLYLIGPPLPRKMTTLHGLQCLPGAAGRDRTTIAVQPG